MNAETQKPNLELAHIEREILAELAKGDRTIFIEKYGQENMSVHLDDGTVLNLPTVMSMCQKRWLCYRPNPHRYRLTTNGMRIIETRL